MDQRTYQCTFASEPGSSCRRVNKEITSSKRQSLFGFLVWRLDTSCKLFSPVERYTLTEPHQLSEHNEDVGVLSNRDVGCILYPL